MYYSLTVKCVPENDVQPDKEVQPDNVVYSEKKVQSEKAVGNDKRLKMLRCPKKWCERKTILNRKYKPKMK